LGIRQLRGLRGAHARSYRIVAGQGLFVSKAYRTEVPSPKVAT